MQVMTSVDDDRIKAQRDRDEFFWLDLKRPSPAQLGDLGEVLDLHPLALEDTREFGQRPKVDIYDDNMLVVFYTARVREQQVEPIEIHLYVAGGYIVTVRNADCVVLDKLHEELAPTGTSDEDFLIYRIFDALTDAFYPAVETFEATIDALEAEVIARARPIQRGQIYRLRQDVRELHRIVASERDQFDTVSDALKDMPGVTRGSREYLRDVADHLTQILGEFQRQLEDLGALTATYFSANGDRLNAVATRISVLGTFFLVWTLVTGFFGQNFGWLTGHIDGLSRFLVFGVGGLLVPTLALAVLFIMKRKDWF